MEGEKTVNFSARSTTTGAPVAANIYVGRYGASASRTLVVRINAGTAGGTLLLNQAEFDALLTISTPAAFLTLVT